VSYTGFTEFYNQYHALGLEIIDMPSNDFNQEPKSDAEIKSWVAKTFGSKFVLLSKDHVNGSETSEVYRWLRQNSDLFNSATSECKKITWNYQKFLVDRNGQVVKEYDPQVEPKDILPDILKLLN